MSKYNLKDLLPEGMSDAEFKDAEEASRLEKHPEGDKIAKIQAMMAKEKSMKESYQMDGEVYDRIHGLTSQPLLKSFIDAFKRINSDYIESGEEFYLDDVVDYLTIQLDKESRNMNEGSDDKTLEESSVDEREFDFFTSILDGRYKEEDIEDYLKSDDYQAAQDEFKLDDTYTSDWVQEFANYFDSRMDEGNALDADEDTDAMIAKMRKDGKSADDFIDEDKGGGNNKKEIERLYQTKSQEELEDDIKDFKSKGDKRMMMLSNKALMRKKADDEGLKEHFQRFLKDYQ